MATLYDRKDSPFWYARVWDLKKKKWKSIRTDYRKDDPTGKRKALTFASAVDRATAADRPLYKAEGWDAWVPGWLKTEYSYNPKTQKRYENAWASLHEFLVEEEIAIPRQLIYAHAGLFLKWRTKQKRHCGKLINHNTAVTELKIMGRIMREAQRRGYTEGNPFYQLGLKRINVHEKPEITDEEIAKIRKGLIGRPAWMQVCFEIALHQGCRLSETSFPLDKVDLNRGTITFSAKARRGQPHVFTTALHPDLRALFLKLKQDGARMSCELPKMAAKEWHFFFKEIELPHLSFHSTRVTVVTRMARNGVTQQKAMAFVGHASETVHRIYQRLSAQDVAGVTGAISFSK